MKQIINLLTEIRDLLKDQRPTQLFQTFSNTEDYATVQERMFDLRRAQQDKETT